MNANAAILSNSAGADQAPLLLPINAVERDTGVTRELLRMWERRYGFPHPLRDAQGDRVYPLDQIAKLRLMRQLIDAGFRPGKLVAFDVSEMETLVRSQGKARYDISSELEAELMSILKARDPAMVRDYLSHQLIKMGLEHFVVDFLQHANFIIGDSWRRGLLEIHEEHLFTEQVQTLIRQAIGNLREVKQAPRIMLTTPPGETHTLGMLMVEALLRLDDVDALCYGAQMPVQDVVTAVHKQKMNIVALSFSAACPVRNAIEYLEELRFRLPLAVDIWAGGGALRSTRRSIEAVQFFHDLSGIRQAAKTWRIAHGVR